jgi:hypothetical protein
LAILENPPKYWMNYFLVAQQQGLVKSTRIDFHSFRLILNLFQRFNYTPIRLFRLHFFDIKLENQKMFKNKRRTISEFIDLPLLKHPVCAARQPAAVAKPPGLDQTISSCIPCPRVYLSR